MKLLRHFAAALIIPLILCTAAFCAEKSKDIVILYTNDVHSAVDTNIGYAGLAAMKQELAEQYEHVLLVDSGDMIQGDVLCTFSKGMDIINIVNRTGYDVYTLGNHEFDYGLPRLEEFINRLKPQCVSCNIAYSGSGRNIFAKVKPYVIKDTGGRKTAFIGVTTPDTFVSVSLDYFKEDGKLAYNFFGGRHASVEGLAKTVQEYVNAARREGADTVILLSHLGDTESCINSRALIKNSYGIDVVLDGHDHHVLTGEICKNKDNKEVLLTSTGARFANVGKLIISPDGKISSELISKYDKKDPRMADYITLLRKKLEKTLSEKAGHTAFELSDKSTDGIRLTRNRETGIGNFCADAVKYAAKTDIAFINGGGIRASIPAGDITTGSLLKVFPFDNQLSATEISGKTLLDILEFSCRQIEKDYQKEGKAVGEFGGFLNVSGLSFTVDTSIPSPAAADENNIFAKIDGRRRISNVWLIDKNGRKTEKIDENKTYGIASVEYLLDRGGNGYSMLKGLKKLQCPAITDCEALKIYIRDGLNGEIPDRYKQPEGRITIK